MTLVTNSDSSLDVLASIFLRTERSRHCVNHQSLDEMRWPTFELLEFGFRGVACRFRRQASRKLYHVGGLAGGGQRAGEAGFTEIDAELLKRMNFMPTRWVTDDLRSYGRPVVILKAHAVMNLGCGVTTERRTRSNQPDHGSARCTHRVFRASAMQTWREVTAAA
jgi:hypothetical protein